MVPRSSWRRRSPEKAETLSTYSAEELGYLQRAPKKSYDADPFNAPMRSSDISLPALVGQCDYLFGKGTGAAGLRANHGFNARFGGARPRSGAFCNSSRIYFMNWSDDPWQEASVTPHSLSADDEANQLQYCMTNCGGRTVRLSLLRLMLGELIKVLLLQSTLVVSTQMLVLSSLSPVLGLLLLP